MSKTTIILIILSVILAGLLSFFQYLYKATNKSKVYLLLAFLRFLTLFGVFILLINPIITRKSLEIKKTPLPIVVDNSISIKELVPTFDFMSTKEKFASNKQLNEKFELQFYQFDKEFESSNQLDFKGNQTNIDNVAHNLKQLYRNSIYPVVLFTDGNQTIGNDYMYSFNENNQVFPVVLGDTTTVFDVKINQTNVNKYVFLKNKFPVELFLQYNGTANTNATLSIQNGNQTVHKQNVAFTPKNSNIIVSVLLEANQIGLQKYKATLTVNQSEKNKSNNSKNFTVEVIDQRTEIAIISAVNHPDIGVLKRSIEANNQRKVNLLNPNNISELNKYNLLILYQPTPQFKSVFESAKQLKKNLFICTGNSTDFNFLNQVQNDFQLKVTTQKENYTAQFNANFNLFMLDNIGFDNFPPLENPFGTITSKGNTTTLLEAKTRGIATGNPLVAFSENNGTRNAYLFGENTWKWRMESYLNKKSFTDYDVFIDKTIQFLASNTSKKNLIVDFQSFYNKGETIEIKAQFFNKNYELDPNAQLTISVENKDTKKSKSYNLTKSNLDYQAVFDGLEKGEYRFTITEKETKASFLGTFEVLDFEIEKQFVNPDVKRLQLLANNTNAAVFYPDQTDQLIAELIKNEKYIPIQKETIKKSPLIDWKLLLVLIALTLSIEWFTRKYNGLL